MPWSKFQCFMLMLGTDNYCVVLAGGLGTRLWPLSRKEMPKQFIDVTKDGSSLLMKTVARMRKIFPLENIIVSTNIDYYDTVCSQLPYLNHLQVLREPVMKGTAPSLLLSAFYIRDINPNAKVLVVPSDMLIMDEEPYCDVITKGMEFVDNNNGILTIGIKPTRPETRFGYIQIDEEQLDDMYKVRTFTEKPEESFARVFVESGEFYWNSGILMWNVDTFIDTASTYLPEMVEQFNRLFDSQHNRDERRNVLYSVYETLPKISIDYGLLEKAENVYMALSSFGWNDIESWDLLYDCREKDDKNNVLGAENVQAYDCKGNLLIENNNNKLVVLDNLNDYLIVDTEDVLVICRRDNEADFKKYVNDAMIKHGNKFV